MKMLYKIPALHYNKGFYVNLNCIQTIIPEDPKPLAYTIVLSDGEAFEIYPKDFEALKKVLIKEGLMIPDEEEN